MIILIVELLVMSYITFFCVTLPPSISHVVAILF